MKNFGAWTLTAVILGTLSFESAFAQDAANGESVFKACRACHQVGEGAKNAVGPVLNGVIGARPALSRVSTIRKPTRRRGRVASCGPKKSCSNISRSPMAFMPKTKMAYAGVKDEGDRKDVIAYLKTFAAK